MSSNTRGTLAFAAAVVLLLTTLAGCSENHGPSLSSIPRYPGATEGESMAHASLGNVVGGSLVQFTTTDPFDEVLAFYTEAMKESDPQVQSFTCELGRQSMLSIPQRNGTVTVAIQEFTEDGEVNITFMGAGT